MAAKLGKAKSSFKRNNNSRVIVVYVLLVHVHTAIMACGLTNSGHEKESFCFDIVTLLPFLSVYGLVCFHCGQPGQLAHHTSNNNSGLESSTIVKVLRISPVDFEIIFQTCVL